MWKRLRIICAFIPFVVLSSLVLSCFLSSASAATTPAATDQSVTLTYSEYRQLNDNLLTLAQNSTEQRERINQLEILLQTASLSTSESKQALIEARQRLNEARAQTAEQAHQLQTLNTLLTEQNKQIEQTQISLVKANESLKTLETELKDKQQEARKNKVWAIVATSVAVYLISK